MAYVPVQRDEGRILYQSTMDRAKLMGDTLTNLGETLYKREEENKAFQAKNSALKQLILANKEQFGLDEATAKQFVSGDINKSAKENYLALASFLEGNVMAANLKKQEEELKTSQAQRALMFAQAQGALAKASAPPAGQRMTQEQFLGLPAGMDATAVPVGDGSGDVIVKSISGRTPEKQDITPVNTGGETVLIDKNTGREVRRIPNTPSIPAGFEMVPGTSAQPSPAPMAAAMPVPESLSQFMPARSMAPAGLSLAARQGAMAMQPAPGASPAAIEAMNAVQTAQGAPRMAAVQPVAPAPAGDTLRATPGLAPMAIRPIAGSPAAIEAQKALKSEAKARDTLKGNIDTTMDTIKKIERTASKYSVGSPGVANAARVVGQFLPASTDVKALLQTLEGNIAFDALRNLKASDTSLGQIAIKELELLKASKGTFEQAVSYPLFIENLNRFKIQTEYAGKKLQALNSALEKGLTEPTKEFYELEKQQNAALKALEKTPEQRLKDMGIKVKLL
jgi:hypothetical protein